MGGLTPGQFGRARLSPETTNQNMQSTLGGGAGDRAGIDLVTNSPPQQATYPAPLPNTQW